MLYPQQNSCRSTSSLDGVWNLRFEWDADDEPTCSFDGHNSGGCRGRDRL